MRVLIISTEYLPVFNKKNEGAIQQLERLYIEYNSKLSLNKKDDFVVYSPKLSKDDYDKNNVNNCEFRIINKTSLLYFIKKCIFYIKKKIFKNKSKNPYITSIIRDLKKRKECNYYDLIIFENGVDYINHFKRKTKTRSKIVLHLHNDYLNIQTKNGKTIVKSIDEVWAVSNYIKKRINELDQNANVKLLYNTCNPIYDKVNQIDEINILKNNYNIENNYVFLYVGRLIPQKGVKELVEAYNIFNNKIKNSKLFVIGQEENSKKGKNYLKDIKGISNNNIIYTGYVKPEKLRYYYALSNVQVVPSICGEAFGLILLEGMKNNIKIIANNVGALKEVGQDKIYYTDDKNLIMSLVDKMIECYNSSKKLPRDYYQCILEKYSNENYFNSMYELIHKKEEKNYE